MNDMPASTTKVVEYYGLNQIELELMLEINKVSNAVGALVSRMMLNGQLDTRWVAAARTDLQKGFMELRRSIAHPDTF